MDERVKNRNDGESGVKIFEPLSKKHQLSFSDVGGLDALKKQAKIKIIQPFKNPEIFKRFKKSAGGGILLYEAPGCGKSYFARAIAGECGALFYNVTIDDILDMYVGESEKNIKALFDTVRSNRPAVMFIDEIDALGRKRELLRNSSLTTTINAFLAQMDGVESDNEDILIIGATNAPWDVDSAFKRTGRFDRTFFIPPADEVARREIFELYLKELPIESLEYQSLSLASEGLSGADIKGVVDRVAEQTIEEILEYGEDSKITQEDLLQEIEKSKPTTSEWFSMAKNVVEYANSSGIYDELDEYMKSLNSSKKKMGFL